MYEVKGNIWIEGRGSAFIGAGRIELLERIKEHGSIMVAAKSMKMSYRQAWELVDSMNKQSKIPLVKAVTGGKGGGGTRVTGEGERLIALYRSLSDRFRKYCEEETKNSGL